MQVLIYKTELNGLAPERLWPRGLAPGEPIELQTDAEGIINAYGFRTPRFWTRHPRRIRLGALNEQASEILRSAVQNAAYLRIRIVEIQPAHLAGDGRTKLAVSVWGNIADLTEKQRGNPSSP